MLTTNIIQRVVFVSYNGLTGTAFTIEKNERQYLVSAKHVFFGLTKQDKCTGPLSLDTILVS